MKSSQEHGPQEITIRGRAAAVVLSRADHDRLRRRKPRFVDFLRQSPLVGVDLELERNRSLARGVTL